MDSTQYSKILLIQALEQSDSQGQYIPYSTRQQATQYARKRSLHNCLSSAENSTQYITNRAESLWNFLTSSYPTITHFVRGLHTHVPPVFVIGPAFAIGLFLNGLGTSQRINLLNFPLFLLLLWNIGVYTLLLTSPFLKNNPAESPFRFISMAVIKVWTLTRKSTWSIVPLSGKREKEWLGQSSELFISLWWKQARGVIFGHVRVLLHLGAACVALGIILSMYFRGLVLDYRATWESTFLTPAQVQGVLHGLLGPAAWILGLPIPGVEDVARLQAPGHGPAAPWIHIWALTSLMGIVLPRLFLAWTSSRSAHKAAGTFSLALDEPYYLQLLANQRGEGIQIDIVPYSYRPSTAASDILGRCLLDIMGNQAMLHWHDPVAYGQDHHSWLNPISTPQTIVLICNLAQTPEAEVHGEMFQQLQSHIQPLQKDHHLLLLLDEESYRTLADSAQILERRITWKRLADEYHLQMVSFNPQETTRDELIRLCHAALWPRKRPIT